MFILTVRGNMESAIAAIPRGADDYLLKPCDIDELYFRMKHFFKRQNILRKMSIYRKILPICMYCKKIRDDTGTEQGSGPWLNFDEYLLRQGGISLSHGCCPECSVRQERACLTEKK